MSSHNDSFVASGNFPTDFGRVQPNFLVENHGTAKVLRVKTEATAHIVIRNGSGKKLFEIELPGVSLTVTVPSDAEIRVEPEETRGEILAAQP